MPEERPLEDDASTEGVGGEEQREGRADGARSAWSPVAPGDVLGKRFRVVRLIARGGMGEVYEALDLVLGSRVALKTLRMEQASSTRALERFRQEILLARKIGHPNVCRVFELHVGGPGEPPLFLTMELLDGETLAERIHREGPLSEAAALTILQQVAAALGAAHAAGVVHRDLKTRNVMLVPTGDGGERAVVTDFGIARALDSVAGEGGTWDGPVGTPAYMAPEQITGGPISPATDIYGLGVLMYELTTGRLPFSGETPADVASQRTKAPPPEPRRLAPQLSERWNETTRWCLSVDPARRPRSPEAVVEALLGRGTVPRRRRRLVAPALVLAALAAAAVGVWRVQVQRRRLVAPPPRVGLAVLQAANLTGDRALDWLSVAMPEALTTELDPVQGVRLVPASTVAERQVSLGAGTDRQWVAENVGSEPQRRLAEALGARDLLILSFDRQGEEQLAWSARLQAPGPDPPLAEVSTTAAVDAVEPAARDLARKLTQAMHWDRAPPEARSVLIPAQAFPRSELAKRWYAAGLWRLSHIDGRGAAAMFSKVIETEPAFLPAHARLLDAEQVSRAYWWDPFSATTEHAERALAVAAAAPASPERTWVEAWAESGSWEGHAKLAPLLASVPDDPELRLEDALVSPPEAVLQGLADLRKSSPVLERDPRVDVIESLCRFGEFQFKPAFEAIGRGLAEAGRRSDRLVLARLLSLKSQILYLLEPSREAEEASLAAERTALDAGATGLVAAIRLARAQRLLWWGRHRASTSVYREALADLQREGEDSPAGRAGVLADVARNELEVGNREGASAVLAELEALPVTPEERSRLLEYRLFSAVPSLKPVEREKVLRQAMSACGESDPCKHRPAMALVLELIHQDRVVAAEKALQDLGPQARGTGGWAWVYLRVMSALGRCPQAYAELQPFVDSNRWLKSLIGSARIKAALASCLVDMKDLERAESLAAFVAPYFVGSDSLADRSDWLVLQSRLALAKREVPPELLTQVADLVGTPGMQANPCLRAEVRMYQGRLLAFAGQAQASRGVLGSVEREARRDGCLRTARQVREASLERR